MLAVVVAVTGSCIPAPRLVSRPVDATVLFDRIDAGMESVADNPDGAASQPDVGGGLDTESMIEAAVLPDVVMNGCTSDAGEDAGCPPIGVPRLRAPLSGAMVSGGRPTLRWSLPPGVSNVMLSVCGDAACTVRVTRHTVNGSALQLPEQLSRGVWFWNVQPLDGERLQGRPSVTWEFWVVGNAARATSWDGVADIDRDGNPELIIGAPGASGGVGRVYGFAAPEWQVPRWSIDAPTESRGGFGRAVHVVGDLDGDGFAELVVRSARDTTDPGGLYLYRGSAAGPVGREATAIRGARAGESMGELVLRAGDLNGDGFGDWATSSRSLMAATGVVQIYLGGQQIRDEPSSSWELQRANYLFPVSMAAADLDDDGDAEIIASSNYRSRSPLEVASSQPGVVAMVRGGASGPDLTGVVLTTGRENQNSWGAQIVAAGDVTGDGLVDFWFGYGDPASHFYLMTGSSSGVDALVVTAWDQEGDAGLTQLVSGPIVPAGDLDQDGRVDCVGREYALRGVRLEGVATRLISGIAGSRATLRRNQNGYPLGAIVATVDYTGDSIPDLVIGDPSANSGAGVVHIYAGRVGGPSTTPTRTIMAPASEPMGFGASIAR